MARADTDGITLGYEVGGAPAGEAVVFIHGAFVADTFRPLQAEPDLIDHYQLITYRRRGYAGGTGTQGPVSIEQQADDCRGLLGSLGVKRAHVVGRSFGGCVALQLSLDAPELVHSLPLIEPALMVGVSAQGYRDALRRSAERYREVGATVAVDEFLEARWPGYREPLERALPGAFARVMADAGATYDLDILGLLEWGFGEADARRITQPVLCILGGQSEVLWPRFGETHRFLLACLPRPAGWVLPGTTHFLQLEKLRETARALAAFFGRHPLTAQPARGEAPPS